MPHMYYIWLNIFNTLRPRQNARHFADDIFKVIFENENVLISIKISLKFIPKGPIYNIPALVQIMATRRLPGDKPLSEPLMIILLTHVCITPPQRVKLRSHGRHAYAAESSSRGGHMELRPPHRFQRIVFVRRAGLLWSQQDFEWWWSVPLSSASLY